MEEKDNHIKIIQITSEQWGGDEMYARIYGLGSDGKVYKWNIEKAKWFLYKE